MEFMNKVIIAVAAALCIGSVAQAQTITYDNDFVDTTVYTGTDYQTDFIVGGDAGNVVIEGSTTAAPGVTGIVLVLPLAGGSPVAEDLNFNSGVTNTATQTYTYNFQFQNVPAGSYVLGYSFTAPGGAVVPVGFSASTESVYAAPEIDPASAAAGLTLLIGGLLVFRGRRTMSPKFA